MRYGTSMYYMRCNKPSKRIYTWDGEIKIRKRGKGYTKPLLCKKAKKKRGK